MPSNGTQPGFAECFQFPEAVRLLWEGTRKALEEWGLDHADLVSLCDIIMRLADHRLMIIEASGKPPGSEHIAEQVRHYHQLASDLHRWAVTPPPEPDWGKVAEKLQSAGTSPLDSPEHPKE